RARPGPAGRCRDVTAVAHPAGSVRRPVHVRRAGRPPRPPPPSGGPPVGALGQARGALVQGWARGLRPVQARRPLRAGRAGVLGPHGLRGRTVAPADHERIVAAGRALIEAGGVEALSMRKLAAEVGVAPTAIYWHVGSREDLLNAVLDAMVDDLPPIAARGT